MVDVKVSWGHTFQAHFPTTDTLNTQQEKHVYSVSYCEKFQEVYVYYTEHKM